MPEDGASLQQVIYTPDSGLRQPVRLALRILGETWRARELAWRLLVRNLKGQHRMTLLGYGWIVLPPLATMLLWVFLRSLGVVQFGDTGIPYPVYVLTGMLFWHLFADALLAPLRSTAESRQILQKVNFPREALVLTGLGEALFAFLVRLLLLGVVLALYRVMPAPAAILSLAGAVVLALMGTVFGLLLTPLGLLYQDVGRGTALLLQFWMYLTPVVYLPPVTMPAALVNWLNPVSVPLVAAREWLLLGETRLAEPLLLTVLVLLPATVGALVFFRLTLPAALDRLGS